MSAELEAARGRVKELERERRRLLRERNKAAEDADAARVAFQRELEPELLAAMRWARERGDRWPSARLVFGPPDKSPQEMAAWLAQSFLPPDWGPGGDGARGREERLAANMDELRDAKRERDWLALL